MMESAVIYASQEELLSEYNRLLLPVISRSFFLLLILYIKIYWKSATVKHRQKKYCVCVSIEFPGERMDRSDRASPLHHLCTTFKWISTTAKQKRP